MNILFVADNFPPERNAQASRVYERACYWVRWGHNVTILTCCPNFPEGTAYPGYRNKWRQVEEMDGMRVIRVKTFMAPNADIVLRILDFLSFMVMAFIAGLFERKADVIGVTSPQFFAAIAGAFLAIVKRVPLLLEISDLWPESIVAVGAMKPSAMVRMLEHVELWLYRRADRIVALTDAFRIRMVRRGVPEHKIQVVLNGVDLSRYQPSARDHKLAASCGIRPDDFVVGYIGTHGMAHGLDQVLEAASLTANDRVRFLFVGAGADRDRLIHLAKEKRLKNVHFLPPQPKERVPAVWSVCDVALVHLRNTPLFETVIPSKIFEAMGMGLPVLLAAPEGEASKIIEGERVGIFVPAGRPATLATAVDTLAEHPAIVRDYAARSRAAATRYTRETQARECLLALARAVSGGDAQADFLPEAGIAAEVPEMPE